MDREEHPIPKSFATTRWSLVAQAQGEGEEDSKIALSMLLTRYWPALQSHLVRRWGHRNDDADDFIQSFVAQVILEGELLRSVDQKKGKFRTFLLTALNRFVANELRNGKAQKRWPGGMASLEDAAELADIACAPDLAFDQAWAREVLAEGLRRMQAECVLKDRPELWEVFEAKVLAPTLDNADPPPSRDLAVRFELESNQQIANLVVTGKRMLARALRSVVAEYANSEDQIDSEIRDLHAILAEHGR